MVGIPPSIPTVSASLVTFAVQTVVAACRLPLAIQEQGQLWSARKRDGSLVTEADYAVQAYVAGRLEERYPRDVLVAEEKVSTLKTSRGSWERIASHLVPLLPEANALRAISWVKRGEGVARERFWLLDPIDATRGLVGGGLYCLNLALIEDGRPVLGVIGVPKPFLPWFSDKMPEIGYLYVAVREAGAWWTFLDGSRPYERLAVSTQDDISMAVRMKSASLKPDPRQSKADLRRRESVSHALGESPHHIRCPAPMRYPLVAAGQGDLYVHLDLSRNKTLKSWDHAAGGLLVQEAGGRVTDLEGKELDFKPGGVLSRNRGLVVSNGWVHDAALQVLDRIGEGRRKRR